ncbi:hypothetical protein cypCar_00024314 [Cyprinus carpio]|nr:hypothetical protein cypCar_00024314 [Cyprinus carpio]
MNVELLVSLVSEHKELYDKRDSDYKNLDKRELLWRGIADQIGFYVEEVRQKWKSLRDTYTRKKYEDDCRSGKAAKKQEAMEVYEVGEQCSKNHMGTQEISRVTVTVALAE